MQKRVKREPLLRSAIGKYRYCFNWISGGFNDIWASNLTEFRVEAIKRFPNSYNDIDYSTLRKVTKSESEQWDRDSMMMWI
jgi:hypothetical protein